ncbi:hypothetical protein BGZ47_009669 [Haplosporangium gracile]|nr:hypothetical protein BGZ47_009669 [Haplosporangium gracile]
MLSAAEVALPVLGAVAGTILIFICLALFITYQVKAVVRFREAQTLAKLKANNPNDDNDSSNSSGSTEYLEEKRGPLARIGAVQSTDNSQTLLYRSILHSPTAPPPPGYTRSPQSIVIGIDQIEKKAAADGVTDGIPAGWKTEPWQQPKSRSPQDHLKQEQLERYVHKVKVRRESIARWFNQTTSCEALKPFRTLLPLRFSTPPYKYAWSFESSPSSEQSMMISEEIRSEEQSMLVDCFDKINAHYERQFRIVESEILHGSSEADNDDEEDRIESVKSEK